MSHDLIADGTPNSLVRIDGNTASEQRYQAAARLKQARQDAGFRTCREFAEGCGFNMTTCIQHENGTRAFNPTVAAEYSRYLRVSPAWLLFGDTSQGRGTCRMVGVVDAHASVTPSDDREGSDIEEVPDVNGDLDVLTVHGTAMIPFAAAGDRVYFPPPMPLRMFARETIDGNYCVVHLWNGDVLVRQVIMQTEDTATLLSLDGQPMQLNVAVQRISPIQWVRKGCVTPLSLRNVAA